MSQMSVATPSLQPPLFVPAGWPVVAPDLLMGYVGNVMVIRIGAVLPSESFARYLTEWARAVDARPAGAAVFAMYDIPEWPGMTALQRKQWGAMLKSREETLRRTTSGMLLAAPSPLTRGAARAILARPAAVCPRGRGDSERGVRLHRGARRRAGRSRDARVRGVRATLLAPGGVNRRDE